MEWSVNNPGERLLAQGGLGAALFGVLPPAVQETLRRCAAQRTFDRSLYEEVLRPQDGPGLDELLEDGHVKPAEGETGRYRLTAVMQEPAFADWWVQTGRTPVEPPIPPPLRQLAAAAAGHDADRPLDTLDALLLSDQAAARSLFVKLYDAADNAYDLSRCQVLLDVLQSRYRLPLLDQDLLELQHERSAYLGARDLWSTDYNESASYVPRPMLEQALEDLLRARGGPALQLHAASGMGKSMQLRWLIARRCVPAPHMIPCARIDFDVIASAAATRHPWLLLVEIAAQLDSQLPYGPFQDLLVSYSPYRTLLLRATGAPANLEVPVSAVGVDGADIRARFTDILVENVGERPVVVAFDSVEHLLRPDGEPTGVLDLLGRLCQEIGSLRLILAGRDDLRSRLPGLSRQLPGLRSVEVGPLGGEEQRRYLSEARQLGDPELVEAIIRRSGGIPSQLDLLADVVRKQPGITPDEVGGLEGQDLAERLLQSVGDERLRWLLRYGVVPRRLTYPFFAEVLAPFMTPVPPAAEISTLWHRLARYAGGSVWVSVVLDDQETIRYHSAVAPALRQSLREQPLSAQLHQAAAQWFEELSRRRPGAWGPLVSEAVYHRFQVDTASGAEAWREAIAKARGTGRHDWVLQLTEELLGSRDVDEPDAVRDSLPSQALAEAYVERGQALAELALDRRAPGDHPLWCDAEDSLQAATYLAQSTPQVQLPEPSTSVLRSRVLIAQGRPEDAEKGLRDQRATLPPSPAAAEVERALGDTLWRLRSKDSAGHYRQSYELAAAAKESQSARLAALGLARQLIDQRRVDEALYWLGVASGYGDPTGGGEQVMLARADALSLAGMPLRADRELAEFGSGRSRVSVVLATKRASLLLAADMPAQAVAACSGILRRLTSAPGESADVTSEVLAIRGSAQAMLLEFESAIGDLTSAVTRARDLRDLDGAAEHAAQLASLQMIDMGDLRGAAQAIDEAERVMSEPGRLGWIAARLAQAQWLDRVGQPSDARELLDSIWPVLEQQGAGPVGWIRTAVGGLALSESPSDERCLRELVTWLNQVRPPAARLSELQGLQAAATRASIDPSLAADLVDAAVTGWRDAGRAQSPEPTEQALLGLTAAEVLRMVGRGQEARALLDDAVALHHDDLLWWRWLQAQERIGPASPGGPVPPEELGLATSCPVLGGAYLITLAQHRLAVDGQEQATKRLDQAAKLLSRRPERTNRWLACLHEAEARIASSHGQHEAADRGAAGAARTWSKLGDDTRLEKLGQDYELGPVSRDLDVRTLELRFSRFLDGEPKARVTITLADGPEAQADSSLAVLGDVATGGHADRLRSAVDRAMEQWDAWVAAAGQVIPDQARTLLAGPAQARRLDVRLVLDTRELAAVPWELARLPEAADTPLAALPAVATLFRGLPREQRDVHKVHALQVALGRLGLFGGVMDGLLGPGTLAAMRRFQEQAGVAFDDAPSRPTWDAIRERAEDWERRPVRVLVIRPSRKRELGRSSGVAAGGSDFARIYRRYGAEMWVLKNPTPAELRACGQQLHSRPPDVVHVCGTVALLGGATVLDLGGDASTRGLVKGAARADQLSVSALGELLAALEHAPYGPVVVLDVAAPQTRAETIRALLVRNSLAHQLLRLGYAVAVIGTGLAAIDDQEELYDCLAGGLAIGNDAATVVEDLYAAKRPGAGFETMLAFHGASLHLHRPPYTLLPLGLA